MPEITSDINYNPSVHAGAGHPTCAGVRIEQHCVCACTAARARAQRVPKDEKERKKELILIDYNLF